MADESGNNWMQAAMSGLMGVGTAISRGGPKRQYKYAKKMANWQNHLNRANAEWVLAQNRDLSKEQREYDSPAQQMARFKKAGLNPHLAYTQGNVGNMNSPVTMGSLPSPSYGNIDTSYPDIPAAFMDYQLAQSQMGLTEAKTSESGVRQEVMAVQKSVMEANPYLRPAYVTAIVDNMEATAKLKSQEAVFMTSQDTHKGVTSQGEAKMTLELEALAQRVGLNTADQKLKAKIIESVEFKNELQKLNLDWLKNADFNAEHVRQGLMLLLSRLR